MKTSRILSGIRAFIGRYYAPLRGRRGAAALEAAMLIPILMMALMGVFEGGNMFRNWLTLQKAAQAGARYAATGQGVEEGTRMGEISAKALSVAAGLSAQDVLVSVRSWPGPVSGDGRGGDAGGPCETVEVRVAIEYQPMTPLLGPLMPSTVSLSGIDRKVNEPWYPCP